VTAVLTAESPFVQRARRERPAVRLVCLPHAGGGASAFGDWPDLLPERVEPVAIQLPGREDRQEEPPYTALRPLVRVLTQVLRPYLGVPVALYGHCAGGVLAFELARELRRRLGAEVRHLFVSSVGAPGVAAAPEPVSCLPDAALRERLRAMGGTPEAVLANEELLRLTLPGIRADFALWEGYEYADGPPLRCPLDVFAGLNDAGLRAADLEAWRRHTEGPFRLRMLPGGHFLVTEAAADLTRAIAEELP
jgi:medium-chain acyl-[acyl-carrier-protein] hydrolase